jgi:hypothetical protein
VRTSPLFVVAAAFIAPYALAGSIGDQIEALPEDKRQALFARLMQSDGERCPSVTRTFLQGSSSDGAVFWSFACSGGKNWQIMIRNDAGGSTKVLECTTIKALKAGPPCFTRFK